MMEDGRQKLALIHNHDTSLPELLDFRVTCWDPVALWIGPILFCDLFSGGKVSLESQPTKKGCRSFFPMEIHWAFQG